MRPMDIPIGTPFGLWVVVREVDPSVRSDGARRRRFLCRCECGVERAHLLGNLRAGRSRSCPACSLARGRGRPAVAIESGTAFGLWVVLREVERSAPRRSNGQRVRQFVCRCACGRESTLPLSNLRGGQSTRCRQCAYEARRGGVSCGPEYRVWAGMNSRCHNPNNSGYGHYGARGIVVCPEWRGRGGFARFLAHVGPRPSGSHSIDRIDGTGNYEPGNVRWATIRQQARNRSNNRLTRVGGELLTLQELGDRVGLTRERIRRLLNRGETGATILSGTYRRPSRGRGPSRRKAA